MNSKYYLTDKLELPGYNIRLLFKAPEDKKKDKKASVILTNPEDNTGAKIVPKPLVIPNYKTLVTMRKDIIDYANKVLINNSFEELSEELLNELLESLVLKINEVELAEDTLEKDESNQEFRPIFNEYLNKLKPRLIDNKPAEETDLTNRNKKEVIEDFLLNYYKDEIIKLQDEISKDNPKKALIIDYEDLERFEPDLADLLISNPEEVIKLFNTVIANNFIDKTTRQNFNKAVINARFKNIKNTVEFKDLKSNRIGELVEIIGTIKKVDTIRPRLLIGLFECKDCLNKIEVSQDIRKSYILRPNICLECGAKRGFTLVNEDSIFTDLQTFTIQQPLDTVIIGTPRDFEVRVTEDLVDKANAGAKVKLTGIFTYVSDEKNNTNYVIEANNIELLEEETIINITPEDEKEILEFSKRPTILKDLVSLFAPKLILPFELKLAILCFIVKGIRVGNRREWINILIIGDPATAKTELKINIKDLCIKCVSTSGTGATAKGLTYSTLPDKDKLGGYSLEAGVLALADKGHAIIDEFDKLKPEDQEATNEAIDSGFIPVNRAGFNTQLPARAGVIAFGNPKGKRFDRYKDLKDQLNIEEDVISRYDLTFILKDIPNEERDSKIFKSLYRPEEELDNTFLKKYLAYVTNLTPGIAEDTIEYMNEYYLQYRATNNEEDTTVVTTARQGEALGRLAGAIAKLKIKEEVTTEEVDKAIDLINYSLENLDQLGVDKTKQQKERELIIQLLEEESNLDNGVNRTYLKELFTELTGVSNTTFNRRIAELSNAKQIIVKGKSIYLVVNED